ncbi:MAG: ASKHA domain-containing protein [Treponema sp.]|nr:ASKHA domain-containing protein [Treponema sp.]
MNIHVLNNTTSCEARSGETLLAALVRGGFVIDAPCGGRGFCGKCGVRLVRGEVRPLAGRKGADSAGLVLACQVYPETDITVELPRHDASLRNEVDTPVRTVKAPARAGIALDLGTTTLSAQLVDMDGNEALDTYSELNDQRVFGADVMSRINAAKNGKTGELFTLINRQTDRTIRRFCEKWGISTLERLVVAGNTTMLHLFTNTDPSSMGEVPFTPVFLETRQFGGQELSLPVQRLTVLPSIAAFIGGDIVSGLASLDILAGADNSLLIDIGTNGEMALFHGGRIYCCSTAAGPALEGAEISCGMGGVTGAISGVRRENGKLALTVIGGAEPRGICGSGLIDVMALMLREGIIDETGALDDAYAEGFTITGTISIINRDVRQYQLAKSAILSGIKILCKNAGLDLAGISTVYIAGGLGFFINKENAIATGLLPAEFIDKIAVCGNLSLRGALRCLGEDTAFLAACERIIAHSVNIDLAADSAFMDEFAENMLFYG